MNKNYALEEEDLKVSTVIHSSNSRRRGRGTQNNGNDNRFSKLMIIDLKAKAMIKRKNLINPK